MNSKYRRLYVYSFYRFVDIADIFEIQDILKQFLQGKDIRGTILIANEGINGALCGSKNDLNYVIKKIKQILTIRKLDLKINESDFFTFNKLKIKTKKEIVTLGKGKLNINKFRGNLVNPSEWNELISNKDTIVLDVRNNFEVNIGNFEGSKRLKTNSFREFPEAIKKFKLARDSRIAMYCTGGIRCEKASAYLKSKGYNKVMQLSGGILNYLEYIKSKKIQSLWSGECFVFDNRITVNKELIKGGYVQCYGCRHPLTNKDVKSNYYKKGVTCPYCYLKRSTKQKFNSEMRQIQINRNTNN